MTTLKFHFLPNSRNSFAIKWHIVSNKLVWDAVSGKDTFTMVAFAVLGVVGITSGLLK